MGTDAGCPFNPYEAAAHEMVLMVMAGLTPKAALDAATRGGAELLGSSRTWISGSRKKSKLCVPER